MVVTAVIALGKRPVPFRTRKLSLSAPMVLREGSRGRVGRRRTLLWKGPTRTGWTFPHLTIRTIGNLGGTPEREPSRDTGDPADAEDSSEIVRAPTTVRRAPRHSIPEPVTNALRAGNVRRSFRGRVSAGESGRDDQATIACRAIWPSHRGRHSVYAPEIGRTRRSARISGVLRDARAVAQAS